MSGARSRRGLLRGLLAPLLAVAVTGAAGLAIVRLAFDHESPAPEAAPSARSSEARDSLCSAAAAVRSGDPAKARAIFLGRTHDQLHMLAADTSKRSRAAAARLLEAKAKIEGGLEPPSPTLAEDLEVLVVATGRAMEAAGGIDPGPCAR